MVDDNYTKDRTVLLFVDPYNDFLSDGGKFWPLVRGVANEVGLLDNLRTITAAIRKAGIQVFIVPHHRWEPGEYENWDHPTPFQLASSKIRIHQPLRNGTRLSRHSGQGCHRGLQQGNTS
jgi:nicotinamidase-related amidase